eukprot:5370986-Prymnesium_polylepis.1
MPWEELNRRGHNRPEPFLGYRPSNSARATPNLRDRKAPSEARGSVYSELARPRIARARLCA